LLKIIKFLNLTKNWYPFGPGLLIFDPELTGYIFNIIYNTLYIWFLRHWTAADIINTK